MNTGKVEIRNGKVVKVFPSEIERVENLLKHLLSIHMKPSTNTQLKDNFYLFRNEMASYLTNRIKKLEKV